MELRILIAYLLIGVLVAMSALFVRHIMINRRKHRRLMRGHRIHKRITERPAPGTEGG
jgi:hypothetical protein